MRTIWKFEFAVSDEVQVSMPRGAEILSVGRQKPNHVCVWALVDTEANREQRRFFLRGTGHPATGVCAAAFLGTVFDGALVWHVFNG